MLSLAELPLAVADAMAIPLADLLSHNRSVYRVRARWVWWAVLRRRGLHEWQIARLVGWDAATIYHGLDQIERYPELCVTVEQLSRRGLEGANIKPLDGWPEDTRQLVLAYLRAVIACKPLGAVGYAGLCRLARWPRLRRAAQACLVNADKGQYGWLIEQHARQAGLRWWQETNVS